MLVRAGVALFAGLTAASAALYPGGSFCRPRARGVDLWLNFFCDLHHARAINGAPNALGSRLGQLGALALVLAVAALWRRFPARGLVRALGMTSVLGTLAVPLTPSDVFGRVHTLAVVLAAGPGIAAVLLASRALPPRAAALGYALVAVAGVDLALYVHDVARGVGCDAALPAVQKLAAAMLVGWVLWADALRRAR